MANQAATAPAPNPYLRQQVMTASPEKLILMLYDVGLKWCRAQDRTKAAKVFVELIAALNFDYKEIALGYFDLYRYAMNEVHRGRFSNAITVLEELRDLWESTVMRRKK